MDDQKIFGTVYLLGDDVDTDQIIPAEHLVYNLNDPEERKQYGRLALSGVPDIQAGLPHGNIPFVSPGSDQSQHSIIVAGKNFGCGSSREHAPVALQMAGVRAVVAQSYARIFYRNAVDGGYLYPLESKEISPNDFSTGDRVEIDIHARQIKNIHTDKVFALNPLGSVVGSILTSGGLFQYAKKNQLYT